MPVRYPHPAEDVETYLRDLSLLPVCSAEEMSAAFASARTGDIAARERLFLAHLRLVVRISYQYAGYGLPLADVISEGNLGLLRAVALFDSRFGTPFEIYASVWVRQRIHRAITAQSKVIRIPVWRSQRLRKLDRFHENLSGELGCDATTHQLAERLGMKESDLARLARDKVSVHSLDAPDAGEKFDHELHDGLPLPGERLSQEELHQEIYAALVDLDDSELQVISSKFGLLSTEPQSYRDMATRMGRNREWVRRVGARALAKMHQSLDLVAGLPRKLVDKRRVLVAKRLETLKNMPGFVSAKNSMLIPWLEALLPAL